jgi:hypothetical protein
VGAAEQALVSGCGAAAAVALDRDLYMLPLGVASKHGEYQLGAMHEQVQQQ